MKSIILICCFFILFLTSCTYKDGDKYDGLILTDTKTNKVYLLKHNIVDTYFINEKVLQISGEDTTEVFK